MATHTRFDRDSGQITGYYSVDGALADLQARGISGIIPGQFDPDTEMTVEVDGQWQAAPRPVNPTTIDKTTVIADGEDTATLSNVPTGTLVSVLETEQRVRVKDGELLFGVDTPGTYTLECKCFPYLDVVFTVEAE